MNETEIQLRKEEETTEGATEAKEVMKVSQSKKDQFIIW